VVEAVEHVRRPVVAGFFYSSNSAELSKSIESSFKHVLGPGSIPVVSDIRLKESVGFVVPHAGYIYSGPIAAHAYYRLALEGTPQTVIIVGTNHTGYGALVSVYPRGKWLTPLGGVEVDEELARGVISESSYAEEDIYAHADEHSVEVQLPFLQYLFGSKFKILPIVIMMHSLEVSRDLAKAIYNAVTKSGRDAVLLASSDMTHYEPHSIAVKKDLKAIEKIVSLDTEGFYKTMGELDISICGPGGIMTLIEYAKTMGAEKARAELLKYATSGDITGDKSAVVGYASIRFYLAK